MEMMLWNVIVLNVKRNVLVEEQFLLAISQQQTYFKNFT